MNTWTTSTRLGAVGIAVIWCGAASGQVRYVDDSTKPGGDGLSWNGAFHYLQDALLAASVDPSIHEIRIAGGTYKPDLDSGGQFAPGDRTASFHVRANLVVRGGYRGLVPGGDPDERDTIMFASVLSGDLLGNDQPNWVNHGENSANIVWASNLDSSTVLDGLVVQAGYAAGPGVPTNAGAGLFIENASPVVTDCRFEQNLAASGAAVVIFGGSPSFSECVFSGNYAWAGRGGAMYGASGSSITITDCSFNGNSSHGAGGVGDGGAIFLEFGSPMTLTRCTFVNNYATAQMVNFAVGGALCSLSEGVSVRNCSFFGNESQVGGAVWTGGNVEFVNCAFSGNTALVGGGVALFTASAWMIGCTLSANDAGDGGGIEAAYSSVIEIADSVLWGNTSTNAPSDYKAAVHKDDTSDANISYSCVQGVFTPEKGEDPPDPANFPGCTEANPLLADANGADNVVGTADDDLRLLAGSPAIDSGDNGAMPVDATTDLDGQPRFYDDPVAPNAGLGTPPIVDMGAYERQPASVLGDLNGDAVVNAADLALLLGAWGPCVDCPADLNGDGAVNASDLALLLGNWG